MTKRSIVFLLSLAAALIPSHTLAKDSAPSTELTVVCTANYNTPKNGAMKPIPGWEQPRNVLKFYTDYRDGGRPRYQTNDQLIKGSDYGMKGLWLQVFLPEIGADLFIISLLDWPASPEEVHLDRRVFASTALGLSLPSPLQMVTTKANVEDENLRVGRERASDIAVTCWIP